MAALLSLVSVAKRYTRGIREVVVLDDVSLDLYSGDFACVIAPSRAGKTTLVEIAAGIRPPDSGRVLYGGRDLAELSEGERSRLRRTDITCVANRSVPIMTEDVVRHVALPLTSARMRLKHARRQAVAMLERVGASGFADARMSDLSAGERTRVSIAQACVRNPRLLIADELTDTLDLAERNSVLGLLQSFAREGVGILMTAGDAHGAVGCNRLMTLSGGHLIEPDLKDEPSQPEEADVLDFPRREPGAGA